MDLFIYNPPVYSTYSCRWKNSLKSAAGNKWVTHRVHFHTHRRNTFQTLKNGIEKRERGHFSNLGKVQDNFQQSPLISIILSQYTAEAAEAEAAAVIIIYIPVHMASRSISNLIGQLKLNVSIKSRQYVSRRALGCSTYSRKQCQRRIYKRETTTAANSSLFPCIRLRCRRHRSSRAFRFVN